VKQPAEAVTVRPGETLVLRYDGPLSRQQAHEIKSQAEALLPGVKIVVVQADQIAKLTAETMEDAVRMAQENPGRVVEVSE
jgi:ElaB/YqjD/DUF883 family membrane-anchored ribosome-binding protein